MATTTTESDALPRIDTRYGDKCAAPLWQLRQRECAPEQPATTSRKSALATKYGIAVPKSAGHRGSGAAGGADAKTLLARPSSTHVVVPKKPSIESTVQTRARGPSQRTTSSWGDDGHVQPQQVEAAQPDSSRAFTSPRPFGTIDRCVGRCTAKLDGVRSENATLRLEIAFLHEKLVEKLRGGSKIVAGGQFRGRGSGVKPVGAPASSTITNCSTCASVRLHLRQCRHELAHTQRTTEELQREVAKMEAMEHTLWTENASQLRELHELRAAVEQFQHAQMSKNQTRALEEQMRASQDAETQTCTLSGDARPKETIDVMTQCSLLQPPQDDTSDALVKQTAALEDQVASLEQALAARALESDRASARLCEIEALLLQERAAHDALCTHHSESELRYVYRKQELEQLLLAAQRDVAAATALSASDVTRLDELTQANASLTAQLSNQCAMMDELEERCKTLGRANESSQVHTTALSSDLARVSLLLANMKTENAQLVSDVIALRQENQTHRRLIEELQQQIQFEQTERARVESEVATWRATAERLDTDSRAEATRLTQALASVRDECAELQTLIVTLERDHEAFVVRLKASHTTALERALHAAIRLCIVAPTVNVHLSDAGSSASKTESSTVVCKPTAPLEQIRDVVETEILPFFTRLVVQREHDDAAAVSDDGLKPWVRDLLQSMQGKITEQLRDVYRTNGA